MNIRSNRYKYEYLNFVNGKTYWIGYHQYWLVTESQWNHARTTTTLLSLRERSSTAILISKFIYTAILFLKLNCDFLTFSNTPHPHDSPHTAKIRSNALFKFQNVTSYILAKRLTIRLTTPRCQGTTSHTLAAHSRPRSQIVISHIWRIIMDMKVSYKIHRVKASFMWYH